MDSHREPLQATLQRHEKTCGTCGCLLPLSATRDTRQCAACQLPKTRVLMCFSYSKLRGTWTVFFRLPARPKPLPREFTFADPDKIRSLYQRFGEKRLLEDKAAFEHGIETGRGLVELLLGEEQLAKLQ